MPSRNVATIVFDIESVADGELIQRLRYPGEQLSPVEAIRKYKDELLAEHGRDFRSAVRYASACLSIMPLFDRVDWEASEFVPIMGVNAASSALTVSADGPYETVEDFVQAAVVGGKPAQLAPVTVRRVHANGWKLRQRPQIHAS